MKYHEHEIQRFLKARWVLLAIVGAVVLAVGFKSLRSIPAGHIGVATLFGNVRAHTYRPGLHLVNPLYRWTVYDARQKTHLEIIGIPSQDQLITESDVSVQFRLSESQATSVLSEAGTFDDLVQVHLIPNLRSIVREQGKSVENAEDFYLEAVQSQLQANILVELQSRLRPEGIIVDAVLLRRFELPAFIVRAIEQKKEREQATFRQQAELERFRTEQQQLIATADAEKQAAEIQAQQLRILADARAYEIEAINKAIEENPAYIQLQALEALKAISGDPSAKIYFLNDQSPVPLLHFGEARP